MTAAREKGLVAGDAHPPEVVPGVEAVTVTRSKLVKAIGGAAWASAGAERGRQ